MVCLRGNSIKKGFMRETSISTRRAAAFTTQSGSACGPHRFKSSRVQASREITDL
jgi:hypothetical protein